MTNWNASKRKKTDQLLLNGLSDPEVASALEHFGLPREEALFRAANRRSKLLRRGEDIAKQGTAAAAAEAPASVPSAAPTETVPTPKTGHYLLPRLVKLLEVGFNVYLWGPAGSGKTSGALMAAEALARRAEIDTLDPSTFRSMVQGYRTPAGEPVHTCFSRCWETGSTYVADELDNAPGHVQTLFNAALANGHAPLAWGQVDRRDGFGFIGTGNTPGRPTRSFPDRRPMSAAFTDRLYYIHWPIDERIECRAAGLSVPAAPKRPAETCSPQAWGKWVLAMRKWAKDNAPTLMITPRATMDGIKALAIGETPTEVADALVFRGCDDDLKRKALHACPLPSHARDDASDHETAREEASAGVPDYEVPDHKKDTDDVRHRAVVSGTKWSDSDTRDFLKERRGKWRKASKTWSVWLDSAEADWLRQRGCSVEVL